MKQFTKQQNKLSLPAIALLGVLLGAQVGAFAFQDPGGGDDMPPAFNYGFNSATLAFSLFPSDAQAQKMFIVGRCNSHYSKATDYNECIYGAEQA